MGFISVLICLQGMKEIGDQDTLYISSILACSYCNLGQSQKALERKIKLLE